MKQALNFNERSLLDKCQAPDCSMTGCTGDSSCRCRGDKPGRLSSCGCVWDWGAASWPQNLGMPCWTQGGGTRVEQPARIPSAHETGISLDTSHSTSTTTHHTYSCSQRKAAFQRKQTIQLGSAGAGSEPQSATGHVDLLLSPPPRCILPGVAGGDRQHLEKGVALSIS